MKKKVSKILAFALSIIMIFSVLPMSAWASGSYEVAIYIVKGGGETGCFGACHAVYINSLEPQHIVIPSEEYCSSHEHMVPVTRIDRMAFVPADNSGVIIASVAVPDSVEYIGNFAFAYNKELVSVNLPSSLASIGMCAFEGCKKLSSPMNIPEGVTEIPVGLFFGCESLTTVNVPDSVQSIEHEAFFNCKSLTSIHIPEGVTEIREDTFSGCESLTEIVIPDTVKTIGANAFKDCTNLKTVKMSKSIESIGSMAFYGCESLESIEFPDTLTYIGGMAFAHCSSLESVDIPESINTIYYSTFNGCESLKTVKLHEGLETIERGAFAACESLEKIDIPDSVKSIEFNVFGNCYELTNVKIGKGLESLDSNVFLMDISIVGFDVDPENENFSNDEYGVLYNKDKTKLLYYPAGSLTEHYIMPDSVTEISGLAFWFCAQGLEKISFSKGLTSLNEGDFLLSSPTSVFIPKEIEDIEPYSIGYFWDIFDDAEEYMPIPDFTIYGYTGSEAERYAFENHFIFIAVDCDHEFEDEVIKEATCIEAGYVIRTCKHCDYQYIIEELDPENHVGEIKLDGTTVVFATCYSVGYSGDKRCTACGAVAEKGGWIPYFDHSYSDWITTKEPTCHEEGERTRYCVFEGCNKSESEAIPTTEHDFGEWEVKEDSTCAKEGEKIRVCSICGDVETSIIPKKEHSYIEVEVIKEPTCTEEGILLCRCECGEEIEATAPMKDHEDKNRDGNCDMCGEDLTKGCDCSCHKKGFANFFWKIGNFFRKIFRMSKYEECACGKAHW